MKSSMTTSMKTWAYPVTLEAGEENGVIVASFKDLPEAITEGEDEADALAQASDALGLVLLAYMRAGKALPKAGRGHMVAPPPDIAAKLALLEAFAAAKMTKTEFAKRLGKDEREVRRILDPMHATKLTTLVEALRVLGRRLVVGVERAA